MAVGDVIRSSFTHTRYVHRWDFVSGIVTCTEEESVILLLCTALIFCYTCYRGVLHCPCSVQLAIITPILYICAEYIVSTGYLTGYGLPTAHLLWQDGLALRNNAPVCCRFF